MYYSVIMFNGVNYSTTHCQTNKVQVNKGQKQLVRKAELETTLKFNT